MDTSKILAQFLGDETFPVEWKNEEEKNLFWFFDDNHVPNPVSPMYFSLNGWWGPTCEYLFERFDINTGVRWPAKKINGYVYSAVVPRDNAEDAAERCQYYYSVMPTYGEKFLDWWQKRYLPEILSNFKYLDTFDTEAASIPELMVLLEEAKDIQERHFRLHWILNWAQFQASMAFGGAVAELIGKVDTDIIGKVNVSRADRNWDSLKELWKLKEGIKADKELAEAFAKGGTAAEIRPLLQKTRVGTEFLAQVQAYANEYGYKSIYTHEYMFKLWVEDTSPILDQLKGYFGTDYDYDKTYRKCIEDQDQAIAYLRMQIQGKSEAEKARFEAALELNLRMLPLTPDHHFYLDQSTFAHMRLVLMAIGRKLVKAGLLDDAEDIMFLEYEELRRYVGNPGGYDGRGKIKAAKAAHAKALTIRPKAWVGTVTQWNMYEEPFHTLWGYPERFEQGSGEGIKGSVKGLPASSGIIEGKARVVKSPKEFDSVKKGEIMVCIMTNPAWVVVFSKIAGIVTDTGGVLSHSAIVAREFGIPAVVGTSNGTREIKTGQTIRVNGSTGIVEIL